MNSIIANRYAKAVLNFVLEKGPEDAMKKDMIFISKTLQEHLELQKMLKNPFVKPAIKKNILLRIFKNISETSKNFIALLVKKNRLNLLKIIAHKYIILYENHKSISAAYITTTVPLNKNLEQKIKAKIEKLTHKNIVIKNKIDKNILGGYIFRVGDLFYDSSILGGFEKLEKNLKLNK